MKKILCTFTLAFFCLLLAPRQAQAQYYCSYGVAYGASWTWQSGSTVYFYSSTELDYCAGLYYDPATWGRYSEGNWATESVRMLGEGYTEGYADWIPAVIEASYAYPYHNRYYNTDTRHYVLEYYQQYYCFYSCGYYWYDPWGWGFAEGGGYGGPSFYGYGGAGYWQVRRRRLGDTWHTIQYRSTACQQGQQFDLNGNSCPVQTPTPTPVPTPNPTTTVSLTATGTQEVGKPTHYLALKDSGNVVITATLSPASADPSVINWTGGSAGADNLHRVVSTSTAATTDVTATVGSQSATVRIHVVDATAAPAAAVDAPKTYTNGGAANPGSNFGLTVVTIGDQGVTRPNYNINPHFNADRWAFRVRDITHSYRLGINSQGRINLPVGNPTPFPQAPGMTLNQSYQEARDDLDTTGLVPTGTAARGPRRRSYWVEHITQRHEEAHVEHFYSPTYWFDAMDRFERDDVEAASVSVVYDCNDADTTTGAGAVSKLRATWDTAITNRHSAADAAEIPSSETYSHGVSNPLYVPIRNQIPTASPTPTPVPRPRRRGRVRRVDAPTYMEAGYSYNVSVTVANDGTDTWTSAEGFRLGSLNPTDNYTWGINRVDLPAAVPTDAEVTFNFTVTAPPTPGYYNFQWGMLQEGVEWFGDFTDNIAIEVAQPLSYCNDPWGEQRCYNYGGWWDYSTCSCQGGYWWYDY